MSRLLADFSDLNGEAGGADADESSVAFESSRDHQKVNNLTFGVDNDDEVDDELLLGETAKKLPAISDDRLAELAVKFLQNPALAEAEIGEMFATPPQSEHQSEEPEPISNSSKQALEVQSVAQEAVEAQADDDESEILFATPRKRRGGKAVGRQENLTLRATSNPLDDMIQRVADDKHEEGSEDEDAAMNGRQAAIDRLERQMTSLSRRADSHEKYALSQSYVNLYKKAQP